jgi:uncharacterized protein involved in exopolysaccharide biosynthesis
LIRILWVHRAMSMWIVVSVLALAVAASLLMPKKYTGESAVVVDARGIDPLAQNSPLQAQQASNYVATQVDVIGSHNVALKVVDRMKLTTDPQIIEKFQDKTGGVGSIRDFAADEILKSLSVKLPRESDVIFINFTSRSPQVAADNAQAAMYDAETRQRQMHEAAAKGLSDESVNLQQSPLLQNLKAELARTTAKFAQVSQRYDHNHPEYIRAQAELESMRSKVAAEVGNVNSAVEREARVARQNMADLQRAMDQQRKRILDLQHNQDEYAVLKREEESARTAYDSAMQRGNETQLESRLKNTNTAILNYAFPPMKPSSPRVLLNVALALILGSMLAVGASLIKERFDQRIHTEVDLLEGAGIAVLAELPRVRISRRRYRRPRGWFRLKGTKPRMEPKIVERLS